MPKKLKKYGMRPIGDEMKRSITGNKVRRFILAEHLEDYISAKVAQLEYQAMGHYTHVQPVIDEKLYYVWLGPRGRRKPVMLEGEKVTRHKGKVPKVRAA
jgi:hypothetical protein